MDSMQVTMPQEVSYPPIQSLAPMRRTILSLNADSGSRFTAAGQVINFTVPTFRGFSDWPGACITGTIDFAGHANNGAPATDNCWALLGSAYSLFSDLSASMGGTTIERVPLPGLVFKELLEISAGIDALIGSNLQLGLDLSAPNVVNGHIFHASTDAAGNTRMSFCIPVLGFLGGLSQAVPCSSELQVSLTVNDIIGEALISYGNMPTSFVLSDMVLTVDLLEFEGNYFEEVTSRPVSLKSDTWLYNSAQLSVGTQGTVDLNILARCQSARRLFARFSSAADPSSKIFNSINPNVDRMSVHSGSTQVPSTPLKVGLPAVVKMSNSRAFGAINSALHPGSVSSQAFLVRDTADGYHDAPVASNSFANRKYAAQWSICIDLEQLPGGRDSLYIGMPLTASSASYLRLEIKDPIQHATQAHMLINADCVLVVDSATGTGWLIF
jgi:hypothetical protein